MSEQARTRVLMLLENSVYPQDPRVRRESQALAEAGYQVSVIAPARRGQPWRETIEGVRVYRFPEPRRGNSFIGYLYEYGYSLLATFVLSLIVLLREGFDVIHAANPPDTLALIAAVYRLFGKRFIYDHHDLAPEMYRARFPGGGNQLVYNALVILERLSCRLADQVIATNQSYRTMEIQRGGVPEERITIVRNGPDELLLRPLEPDPNLRPPGRTVIIFAGAMGHQDGVDYLLRALHHLAYDLGRNDFFCYLVGGAGDARAGLRPLATELGLDAMVCFTGWVSDEDWGRYLSSADICVEPVPSNPFADRSTMIKITEYMAVGKPIVAFDLPEHRVSAEEAALYVQPNDEMMFARGLVQLMDDPSMRARMGAIGRRRIQSELAWQYSVPNLLDAYQKAVGGLGTEPDRHKDGVT